MIPSISSPPRVTGNIMNNNNFSSEIPNELVFAEVTSDLTRMFTEQANLSTEYAYWRMSKEEFIADRIKRSEAGISSWFGWDSSPYSSIIMARILNKTGYKTTAQDISMFADQETKTRVKNAINQAVSLFLA